MKHALFQIPIVAIGLFISSCAGNKSTSGGSAQPGTNTPASTATVNVKEEPVSYTADSVTLAGFIAYDENAQEKRPLVLVVPEWWGLTDYPRMRAKMLAQLGYVAMAVDMYGSGKVAANPQEAQELAIPFYQNPQLAKTRLEAALAKAKTLARVDTARAAAIGYCFGGYVALNAAKLGSDLDGVVSFHGSLGGRAARQGYEAKILVCHGGADGFVPPAEVASFRKGLDSVGADYQFVVYPEATHAFTNPDATESGKKYNMPIRYNAAADSASWRDMKAFFARIF
jgi:dienelactone hydrolase